MTALVPGDADLRPDVVRRRDLVEGAPVGLVIPRLRGREVDPAGMPSSPGKVIKIHCFA